ncbi:hypothetical protein [Orlajensenia leifsoniae]|uniref:Uncharacterized protein n=1 Tax=Orlajensenia leifsoniae TaxID=2561933 RepID=A0A4Y9R7I8_9MICO|nr:hypothetical protein [Leifsonia flava]TFV99892.1 hypothetical protein E4M00_01425 [Leifsonia flava]
MMAAFCSVILKHRGEVRWQILDHSWRWQGIPGGDCVVIVGRMTLGNGMAQTPEPATEVVLLEAVDVCFRPLNTGDVSRLDEVFHPTSSLFDANTREIL